MNESTKPKNSCIIKRVILNSLDLLDADVVRFMYEICILETFRFDAIQITEQVFDSPDVSPLMSHAGPNVFVATDNSSIVVTDDESFTGRPDRVQCIGPPVTFWQVVPGELLLEESNEFIVHCQTFSKTLQSSAYIFT